MSDERVLTEVEMAVAKRINGVWHQKRKSLNLSQERAANFVGWSQGMFNHYINGKRAIGVEAVLQFSKILKEHPMTLAPEIVSHIADALAPIDSETATIATRYNDAPESTQLLVEEIMELKPDDVDVIAEAIGVTHQGGESLHDRLVRNGELTAEVSAAYDAGRAAVPHQGPEYDALLETIHTVVLDMENLLLEHGRIMTPADKARMITLTFDIYHNYDPSTATEPVKAQVLRLLKFAS